jgi:hypothetical protein
MVLGWVGGKTVACLRVLLLGPRLEAVSRAFVVFGTAASLLAGCAGTAETPSAGLAADGAPKAADPIPRGKARLTLTRVSGMLYSGVQASVKINGQQVAGLWAGSSSTVDIAPGANVISVDGWSYPGSWTVDLSAKAGQSYAIEISPRGDSFAFGMFGLVGGAIDVSANKNAGAFQMRVVGG